MTKNQETKQTASIKEEQENFICKLGCFFSGVGAAVGFRTLAHESLKQDRREYAVQKFYATPSKYRKNRLGDLPPFQYNYPRAVSRGVVGGLYLAILSGAFFTGVTSATTMMAKGFVSYMGQRIKANAPAAKENKPTS